MIGRGASSLSCFEREEWFVTMYTVMGVILCEWPWHILWMPNVPIKLNCLESNHIDSLKAQHSIQNKEKSAKVRSRSTQWKLSKCRICKATNYCIILKNSPRGNICWLFLAAVHWSYLLSHWPFFTLCWVQSRAIEISFHFFMQYK